MLKVGDKVKIKRTSQYFETQGMHGVGTITSGRMSLEVRFEDGYRNFYTQGDLQLVSRDVLELENLIDKDKKITLRGEKTLLALIGMKGEV